MTYSTNFGERFEINAFSLGTNSFFSLKIKVGLNALSFFSGISRVGVNFFSLTLTSEPKVGLKRVLDSLGRSNAGLNLFSFLSVSVSFGVKFFVFSSFELVREGVNFTFSFSFISSL